MKRIITATMLCLLIQFASAQEASTSSNEKYFKAMHSNLSQLDTAAAAGSLRNLANNFERIGKAEKNRWEPFYYASYCYAMLAAQAAPMQIDAYADQADMYLKQAIQIEDNSETSTLAALILACRIMVDPMSRFMAIGPQTDALLQKAKTQDPSNPRPWFLQAKTQIKTPEAMGGGKLVAKASLEKAVEKFSKFTSENPLAPTWGRIQSNAMLASLNK